MSKSSIHSTDLKDRKRNKRIEKKHQTRKLAFELGIAQASLSRIENGKEEISIQNHVKESNYFLQII